MQSISVLSDIAKFDDFRWKNADISTTQGVRHVTHIFLSLFEMCATDYREGGFLSRPHPWAATKRPSWIGLRWYMYASVNQKIKFDDP